MSRRRIEKKWKDSYAFRRGLFYFFLFSFSMVGFFKVLKIVNEREHRLEFHRFVTAKVNKVLTLMEK